MRGSQIDHRALGTIGKQVCLQKVAEGLNGLFIVDSNHLLQFFNTERPVFLTVDYAMAVGTDRD